MDFKEKYSKEIAEWKAKYGEGNVFAIPCEDKVCFLRKPNRKELQYAMVVGGNDTIKLAETILNQCWLGGDECFKTDDAYFFGACQVIGNIIDVKQTEIKKL